MGIIYSNLQSLLLSVLGYLSVAAVMIVSTQAALADEDKGMYVKAAFVFNMARYVKWPAKNQSFNENDLKLCLLQQNAFGPAINSLNHKFINNKEMVIRIIMNLEESQFCHILLLSGNQVNLLKNEFFSDRDQSQQISSGLFKNTLIIADLVDDEMSISRLDPVHISLIRRNHRIAIRINKEAVHRSQLVLSSQLLKLSRE